eukprot:CAMPEP_0114538296 /NCGR_PEP_ID=MMETSP0109-20121206/30063_1 /TAXON_ID=29199 /ORGANISM="Chlorarachnion reptans, Strain CCCM449" /LENGTH=313 /DNA_ID=CAMNT_0001722297 /DNA_START=325 /DNA_END=1266 /DNA_ORIENTATION=-
MSTEFLFAEQTACCWESSPKVLPGGDFAFVPAMAEGKKVPGAASAESKAATMKKAVSFDDATAALMRLPPPLERPGAEISGFGCAEGSMRGHQGDPADVKHTISSILENLARHEAEQGMYEDVGLQTREGGSPTAVPKRVRSVFEGSDSSSTTTATTTTSTARAAEHQQLYQTRSPSYSPTLSPPSYAPQPRFLSPEAWGNMRQQMRQDLRVGEWAYNCASGELWWSAGARAILFQASLSSSLAEFSECVHEQDRKFVIYLFRRAVAKGVPFDVSHRVLLPGHAPGGVVPERHVSASVGKVIWKALVMHITGH